MKKLLPLFVLITSLVVTVSEAKSKKTVSQQNKSNTEKTEKKSEPTKLPKVTATHHGKASWYEIKCNGGTQTASGIPLKNHAMTAAHKTLPMGTKVRVTNTHNGKSVILKITDRGPYIKGRIIDVTKGAAKKLGFINTGVVRCKVEVLEK
jgi:rare lipoprotein A